MKKKFFAKVSAVVAMMLAVCFAFTGCGGLFGGDNSCLWLILLLCCCGGLGGGNNGCGF